MGLVALVLLGAPTAAMPQSASFAVSQNGKSVGTASFTFVSKPTGYDSSSIVRVDMQGLNYQLSKTEQLSPSNGLLHVQLSATVNNSAVNIVAKPARRAVAVEYLQPMDAPVPRVSKPTTWPFSSPTSIPARSKRFSRWQ